MVKHKKDIEKIDINDKTFFNNIKKFNFIKKNIKELKEDSDEIFSDIKETSLEKWLEIYDEESNNPGSIILNSSFGDEKAELTFVPSDRYIKIDKESAEKLKEKYNDDIVEEETTFTIDEKMAKKYSKILSHLILNSEDILEQDKKKIIKAYKSYSIKKGTIDYLKDYGNVSDVFETVRPVVSVKNVNLIKS